MKSHSEAGEGQLLLSMLMSFLKKDMASSVWGFLVSDKSVSSKPSKSCHLLAFIRITFIPPVDNSPYAPSEGFGKMGSIRNLQPLLSACFCEFINKHFSLAIF